MRCCRNFFKTISHNYNLIGELEKLKELSVDWEKKTDQEIRNMLEKCAMTAMNSKLISGHKEFFGPMVVDAVTFNRFSLGRLKYEQDIFKIETSE